MQDEVRRAIEALEPGEAWIARRKTVNPRLSEEHIFSTPSDRAMVRSIRDALAILRALEADYVASK